MIREGLVPLLAGGGAAVVLAAEALLIPQTDRIKAACGRAAAGVSRAVRTAVGLLLFEAAVFRLAHPVHRPAGPGHHRRGGTR
ncbi:hypothetical protein [Streptomyces aidingensis]|uniref:Uncharacterized protein n=1 Tax=Streptomyces aidingensis TaxID=910347 RepID=A0A1I1PSJ9_9ACTN|nr:hypothetical protein [Streptomyces aidingensis]SFD12799.1 hypothetical protein SAMN05421773_11027 [Streptomyces aidingensis]